MSTDALERRYRTLLRAYPADYRRERGDELIDTLLGDNPGTRSWPSLREAVALIRGALRVHSGSTAARPTAVLVWQGLHLGALALLALGTLIGLDDLIEAFQFGGLDNPWPVLRDQGSFVVLMAAATAVFLAGRQRTAAVLAVAAVVVPNVVYQYLYSNGLPQWWAPIVATPLIVAGLRRPADVPPVARGNAVFVVAVVLALHLIPAGGLRNHYLSDQLPAIVMVVVGLTGFFWVATADQRLLLAAAPTLLLGSLHQLWISSGSELVLRPDALPSLVIAVVMVAGAVVATRVRRRTRA